MKSFLKILSGVIVISIIFSLLFNMGFVKDNHFNIITISTVMIGFLFTTLSILLAFLNENVIQYLENANCLENIYKNIINGIIIGICSVFISLMNLILCGKIITNLSIIKFLYSMEIALLFVNIFILFIAVLDCKNLIDSIRADRKKKAEKENANNDMSLKFNKINL